MALLMRLADTVQCALERPWHMSLVQLIPLQTLTQTLWRSSMGDFGVFYDLDVAEDLQEAELLLELKADPGRACCRHQGIMVDARVVLCHFASDAATIGSPSRYIRLQEFLESSVFQNLKWRLSEPF